MPADLPDLDMPPEVAEGVGPYYMYALRDPRDGAMFYVGKGTGSRIVSHLAQVRATGDDASFDSAKVSKIRSIWDEGWEVEHLFLRVRIGTEAEAYMVEQAVLDGYAANKLSLSNIMGGHRSDSHSLASLADAIARLGAAPAPALPAGSVIFLIFRKWTQGMSPADTSTRSPMATG